MAMKTRNLVYQIADKLQKADPKVKKTAFHQRSPKIDYPLRQLEQEGI